MKWNRVWAVYWSATGTTRKIVEAVATKLAQSLALPLEQIDLTLPAVREQDFCFTEGDLVIVGTPTYAGRVPNKILPFFQSHITGNGALAVPVVLFGNRSYDHALAELCSLLEGCGFHTVAAGAFVGQHAFSETLAAGRPNDTDMQQARAFAAGVAEKVKATVSIPLPICVPGDPQAPYYIPKGVDGKPVRFLKAKPQTDQDRCNHCGLCAQMCPMGAIDFEHVSSVPGTCIKCHACVKGCPCHAKYFDDPAFLSHKAMLENEFQRMAPIEVFL